jgi:hypothetical protein
MIEVSERTRCGNEIATSWAIADIAVVEADDTKTARGKLTAELVVPMNHLGAEPHDQQQRFRGRIAENLVAKVDAVGVGDLRWLMGERVHVR